MRLDYRDVRPIYVQILENLREQIAAGVLRAGEQIPSVRELAAQLAINPNTIQRAYRELETAGWIVSVPGKGSFVCARPDPSEQREALFAAFDSAAEALEKAGVSREALISRLRQGGHSDA